MCHSHPTWTSLLLAYDLYLYESLQKLQEWVLYMDTYSVIYLHRSNQYNPSLGDYFGDFTNELHPWLHHWVCKRRCKKLWISDKEWEERMQSDRVQIELWGTTTVQLWCTSRKRSEGNATTPSSTTQTSNYQQFPHCARRQEVKCIHFSTIQVLQDCVWQKSCWPRHFPVFSLWLRGCKLSTPKTVIKTLVRCS